MEERREHRNVVLDELAKALELVLPVDDALPLLDEADRPYELVPDPVAVKLLAFLVQRPDGWLRFVGNPESGKLTLFFKWNKGRFANHYVAQACWSYQIGYGIAGLAVRWALVESGQVQPTRDNAYKPTR